MKIETLDFALYNAVTNLQDHWLDPGVGIVGASLITNKREIVATSTYQGHGSWAHAEVNALTQLDENETVLAAITTLSPCLAEALVVRAHAACATLLQAEGITRVHTGYLDTMQTQDLAAYGERGFKITKTFNSQLGRICHNLFNLFGEFRDVPSVEGNPWPEIKKTIGDRPFFDNL